MMRVYAITALALLGASLPFASALAPVPREKTPPEVHAVGVYEGWYPPGVRNGAGSVTVKVGPRDRRVVLVLTSYEPVVWKLEAPKGAVARVIASGYHKQAVEGLDKNVPVSLFSYEAGDKEFFYAYRKEAGAGETEHERGETKRKYDRLVEQVKVLTGQGLKTFQGSYAGEAFDVR